ncbi:MAG: LptF/LptG family permease, partial [Planctomycetota bacterium]
MSPPDLQEDTSVEYRTKTVFKTLLSPVLAAAFTLMRMSRFNELTAALAAGVPMLRIAAPVVICAIAINVIVQPLNQEFVIPRIAAKLAVDRENVVAGGTTSFAVKAMPDGKGGIFDAVRYTPATRDGPAIAETVTIVQREQTRVSVIAAEKATWNEQVGGWTLENATRLENLDAPSQVQTLAAELRQPSSPLMTEAPRVRQADFWQTDIIPAEIELFYSAGLGVGAGGSYYDLLSLGEMNQLLQQPARYNVGSLLRAKHSRLAGHVMNIVLILLAIPCVLTRQPGQLKRAAGKTVLLVGGAMAGVFLSQMLGKDPPRPEWASVWPQVAAWMPVFLNGPLAFVLLDRMET